MRRLFLAGPVRWIIRQRGVMLDFSERGQASFGALPARERDGAVEGDDRARVHLIKLVVLP
jgi:hypothetical protein